MLKLLIEYRVDPDDRGTVDKWPLKEACATGNEEVVKVMLELGANLQHRSNEPSLVICIILRCLVSH